MKLIMLYAFLIKTSVEQLSVNYVTSIDLSC